MGLLLVGFLLATEFLARPWVVVGPSMEPTLFAGDRVLVDRWTFRHRAPRVGELVLVLGQTEGMLVKRIVTADPGDDRFRVLGDNLAVSHDSRHFGPVGRDRVRGRVVWRYWPLSRAGSLPAPETTLRPPER